MPYDLQSYRQILEAALANGYRFIPFAPARGDLPARYVYLRHDVDFSLEMALDLARVNADLGIAGTFCILLRSQVYNPFSARSLEAAQGLRALGQQVALHMAFTPAMLDGGMAAIEARVRADFAHLESALGALAAVFSWHNPTPDVLAWSESLDTVGGLVNTYAARYVRDMGYFADSNLRHSVQDFLDIVGSGQHRALHLLFHPLNWVAGGANMAEVFAGTWGRVIREREHEFRTNRFYREHLPDGMPPEVIAAFVRAWAAAATPLQAEGEGP